MADVSEEQPHLGSKMPEQTWDTEGPPGHWQMATPQLTTLGAGGPSHGPGCGPHRRPGSREGLEGRASPGAGQAQEEHCKDKQAGRGTAVMQGGERP